MKGPVVNSQATQAVTPTAAANPTPTVMASGGLPNTPIKLTADTTRDASYPATIITDKKRRTINLTEEVSSAVGDWWNEKVKSLKGSKKPTYSVPSVERRKGVVHAATTHTGRVATSDHREIVAKLKQETTRAVPPAETTISPAPQPLSTPEVAPLSTPNQAPTIGYGTTVENESPAILDITPVTAPEPEVAMVPDVALNVIEEPTIPPQNNITVTEVTTRSPRILPTIPVPTESTVETDLYEITPTEDPYPEPVVIPAPVEPSPIPVVPLSFPKINPVTPTLEVTMAPTQRENAFSLLSEVPKPTLPTTSSAVKENIASRMEQRTTLSTANPSKMAGLLHLAPYLAGGLFIIITVGGITYFMMTGTSTPPEQNLTTDLPVVVPPGDFGNQTYTPEAVTAQLDAPNKASLFAAVKNTAGLGDGLFIVTPLAHDTAFPLGTREILGLINRQLSPDFVGNINNIQLGMYRDEPVILLSISDENSARGGMFRWETTMSQDLSPWFGQGLRMTNTNNVTSFTDSESAGRDVRILADDIGTERITYGFINQSILLITTNTTAFLNIADGYSSY
jgi:hypothetical protein